MRNFKRIIDLTIIAVLLTVILFVFIASNTAGLEALEKESNLLYCGTSSIEASMEIETNPIIIRGKLLFDSNCKVCHRLDLKLIGPALRNVYATRDSVWLRKMIINGNALVKKKDKTAVALYKEYNQMEHVTFTSLSKEDVDDLMRYFDAVKD